MYQLQRFDLVNLKVEVEPDDLPLLLLFCTCEAVFAIVFSSVVFSKVGQSGSCGRLKTMLSSEPCEVIELVELQEETLVLEAFEDGCVDALPRCSVLFGLPLPSAPSSFLLLSTFILLSSLGNEY